MSDCWPAMPRFFRTAKGPDNGALLTLSPADTRAAINVNVMHIATIGANAAVEVALQIGNHSGVLAFWRVKIDRAARGVIAASAGPSNACILAKCRNDANSSEPCFDLFEH